MQTNFTKEDSLNLINEMITQARDNIQKGAADSMIFAGYSVAFASLLNFILLQVLTPAYLSFWVWLLMIPMSIGCFIISRKNDKQALVKTHVDKIVADTWFAFFISVFLFLISIFSSVFIFKTWALTILITPVIMIMMGAAQYITAITSRFQPFRTGAFIFWAGAILCTLLPLLIKTDVQFLILAICTVFGFIVPGHILNRKAIKNV